MRSKLGRLRIHALLIACLAVVIFPDSARAAAGASKPNVVILLADDMNTADLPFMPRTLARLAQQGVQFNSYYTNVSLCDPSRTTLLTGKYTQNTKVVTNSYVQFLAGGNERTNLATMLSAAGYRTALIGKFLNASPNEMTASHIPPGWAYWFALVGGDKYSQYDYTVNDNGKITKFGAGAAAFGTDVYRDRAVAFIKGATTARVPYFCYLAFSAPHAPATSAPRYKSLFPKIAQPAKPSLNETDVSDKPAYVQALPLLSSAQLSSMARQYGDRLRSLQAVDEAVDAVFEAIGTAGLKNTYVIFASDNGYLLGEHRASLKSGPYEEMVRQPLLVRGPGLAKGVQISALVGNGDLAPTILEWAGVPRPSNLDGTSLAGLLAQHAPTTWRLAYPLRLASYTGMVFPKFIGFRTSRYTYIRYETGDQELYDMLNDPYQLVNLAKTTATVTLESYKAVATALASCSGSSCRTLESDPRLPK